MGKNKTNKKLQKNINDNNKQNNNNKAVSSFFVLFLFVSLDIIGELKRNPSQAVSINWNRKKEKLFLMAHRSFFSTGFLVLFANNRRLKSRENTPRECCHFAPSSLQHEQGRDVCTSSKYVMSQLFSAIRC